MSLLGGLRIWCCYELRCTSQMWLGSGVAVAAAQASSSNLTPSLGTSMCCRCGPKKKKKKKLLDSYQESKYMQEDRGSGVRKTQIHTPVLLNSCVSLNKLLNFSKLSFLIDKFGIIIQQSINLSKIKYVDSVYILGQEFFNNYFYVWPLANNFNNFISEVTSFV